MLINENIIDKIGLTDKESALYELLLSTGETTAGKLIKNSGLKRATVYTVLDSLIKKNLVEQTELAPIIKYQAKHPYVLKELAESRVREIQSAGGELDALLPSLAHLYGEHHNRPGVSFYSGKEGIIKIYETILAQNQPIDSIEEKGDMLAYIPDYVPVFVKKRVQKKLPNRVISPDTNKYNVSNPDKFITAKTLPAEQFPFRMDIKIAGDKVSLITFNKEEAGGVLIDNREIADNFKMIFELLWEKI